MLFSFGVTSIFIQDFIYWPTSTKTTAHTLSFQHHSGTFTITCFIRTTIIMDGIHHHHVVVVGVISASGFFGVFGNTNTTKLTGGSESSTAGDFFGRASAGWRRTGRSCDKVKTWDIILRSQFTIVWRG